MSDGKPAAAASPSVAAGAALHLSGMGTAGGGLSQPGPWSFNFDLQSSQLSDGCARSLLPSLLPSLALLLPLLIDVARGCAARAWHSSVGSYLKAIMSGTAAGNASLTNVSALSRGLGGGGGSCGSLPTLHSSALAVGAGGSASATTAGTALAAASPGFGGGSSHFFDSSFTALQAALSTSPLASLPTLSTDAVAANRSAKRAARPRKRVVPLLCALAASLRALAASCRQQAPP